MSKKSWYGLVIILNAFNCVYAQENTVKFSELSKEMDSVIELRRKLFDEKIMAAEQNLRNAEENGAKAAAVYRGYKLAFDTRTRSESRALGFNRFDRWRTRTREEIFATESAKNDELDDLAANLKISAELIKQATDELRLARETLLGLQVMRKSFDENVGRLMAEGIINSMPANSSTNLATGALEAIHPNSTTTSTSADSDKRPIKTLVD